MLKQATTVANNRFERESIQKEKQIHNYYSLFKIFTRKWIEDRECWNKGSSIISVKRNPLPLYDKAFTDLEGSLNTLSMKNHVICFIYINR